ncbi:hypothetical protein M0P65_06045 [Candidatus Gracilibacteria bacterium]|jgi:hypothetical protein|nr:hypothetical protein [Candidatus Gracilibacteria bacterium]
MSIKVSQLLTTNEIHLLNEIGEANAKQFPWQKKFYQINDIGYFTIFLAPINDKEKIPEVQIEFFRLQENEYSVGYSVNNEELQAFKASMTYYLRLIATIVTIIKDFIKKYNPKVLEIKGVDKKNIIIPGQKNRIYFAYIEKQVSSLGSNWESARSDNKLILIQRNFEKLEN